MFVLCVLITAPDRHRFAQRAGQILAREGLVVAVMDGVTPHRASRFRPDALVVASGKHWVLWSTTEPVSAPVAIAAWMSEAERLGEKVH